MEKTLFGIKFASHLKYPLMTLFLFSRPRSRPPLGLSTLEKSAVLKKEAQKGKSSWLENIQEFGKWQKNRPPPQKKILYKSWSDVSVTSSPLKGQTATGAPLTGKMRGATSELVLSGVTRPWKNYTFHRRKAKIPILGLSNKSLGWCLHVLHR